MNHSGETKTSLHVRNHTIEDFYKLYPNEEFEIMSLDEIRELLASRLQGKSLSDYIREDRDE